MPEFRCYSDASWKAKQPAGYGYVVLVMDGELKVHRKDKGTVAANTNVDAELLAMIRALQCVPSGSRGVAYSDISDIAALTTLTTSYARKHTQQITILVLELERTGLSVEYIPRNHRPKEYRACHRMARQAIGLVTTNKKPKKKTKEKKWWVCRPVG